MSSSSNVKVAKGAQLPVTVLVDALQSWQERQDPADLRAVTEGLQALADLLDLHGIGLTVNAPLVVPLTAQTAAKDGQARALRSPIDGVELGSLSAVGDEEAIALAAHAVELAVDAVRAQARARRAEGNLEALDAAVRGIAGIHTLDRVLQLIVDRVRDLAEAEYAALGIVDDAGRIERFLTSGISAEQRLRIGPLPQGHGLLGLIIRDRTSLRIPEIERDPRRHGFPPHHPEMHSLLGVPVTSRDRPVGNLYLTNKRGAPEFSVEDQLLVERFARHAGLAIENARLGQRVQQLAVVEERERIGRDLHDGIIQRIYAVTLALDDVPELAAANPEEAAIRVDRAIDALHGTIGEIREFIYGLRPSLSAGGDLPAALEILADEVRRHAELQVEVEAGVPRVADAQGIELLNIARESLSNVVRHAGATRVTIRLERSDGRLMLEVADDGRGFDRPAPQPAGHHGLGNMRERAERLRGTLTVVSRPGAGTRIIVSVPSAYADGSHQEGRLSE